MCLVSLKMLTLINIGQMLMRTLSGLTRVGVFVSNFWLISLLHTERFFHLFLSSGASAGMFDQVVDPGVLLSCLRIRQPSALKFPPSARSTCCLVWLFGFYVLVSFLSKCKFLDSMDHIEHRRLTCLLIN